MFLANRNAFFIFLVGTAISLAIFLWLTVDTHMQVDALTHAEKLSDQVVAGKHVWEKRIAMSAIPYSASASTTLLI